MKKLAFVTFLMFNDSYLPGALMIAYALRKQKVEADLVCLVTDNVTVRARDALTYLFDRTVEVPTVFVPHKRRQERQDRPFWFTRFNALRLGSDGDLGCSYNKIVVLDADVLPLRNFDHLFALNTPAGVLNEGKVRFVDAADKERIGIDKWGWHKAYDDICPHGCPIPREITDRVHDDPTNMGVNTAVLVLHPSMDEFCSLMHDLGQPDVRSLVGDRFEWPDMQYMTMRWSGHWFNVDVKFAGFNGYPNMAALYGTHFAGIKPWYLKRAPRVVRRYLSFEDFRYWFAEYRGMLHDYPALARVGRLRALLLEMEAANRDRRSIG